MKDTKETKETPNATATTAADTGVFLAFLAKTNKEIMAARAQSLTKELYEAYRDDIEKLNKDIVKNATALENMLDLHPDTTIGMTLSQDFDAKAFVKKRQDLLINIRNLHVYRKVAIADFHRLLGTDTKRFETMTFDDLESSELVADIE